jgi:hypothetical protein
VCKNVRVKKRYLTAMYVFNDVDVLHAVTDVYVGWAICGIQRIND